MHSNVETSPFTSLWRCHGSSQIEQTMLSEIGSGFGCFLAGMILLVAVVVEFDEAEQVVVRVLRVEGT
jgi:hypothetical protein